MDVELNADFGINLSEFADHPGQQIGARGLAGSHNQGAPLKILQVLDGATGFLAQGQDLLPIGQQHMTRLRELGPPSSAIEKGHI